MHNIHKNLLAVEPNWQKELAKSFTDPEALLRFLALPVEHYSQHIKARRLFPMRVPVFFAELMAKNTPDDPLLRQVLPLHDEFLEVEGYVTDPLDEFDKSQSGIVHKYHNRLLLIVKGGVLSTADIVFAVIFPMQSTTTTSANGRHNLLISKPIPNSMKSFYPVVIP